MNRALPLHGVRILEFCWVMAGPYATMLLARLGAEVIKIEGHSRTDLLRRSVVWPLPEPAPKRIPLNQGMSFNSLNLNKKSVTLDLTKAEGVELAKRIAALSDVVVDNMRPDAMAKIGLEYETLRRVRPDIIVASSSSRGRGGPESDYLGYAFVHHGIGGGAYVTGYPDDHPSHTTADVDLMNATGLAYAIVTALYHRARTGEGQFIDYSQCEGVSSLLGELLLGYELSGEIPERMANAHPRLAPHSVYRCWGVDRWLALEIHSDEEFRVFGRIMGRPDLAEDARFADARSRKANEAELDRIVEAWTRERDRDWMIEELCGAGLAAAPSREGRDLLADPHLRARGAFETVVHPELDEREFVAPPWKLSGCESEAVHAPLLGQHNDEVLQSLLGIPGPEIAALRAKKVIL